jgi:SM-20-related protein
MLDSARYLRLDALRATPLTREPFPYLISEGFVGPAALAAINADYPKISSSGSFPVDEVSFGPSFQRLLDELESEEFRAAFEEKFAIDLSGRPTVTTVRGRCDSNDGRIHTDSKSKIITVLIYMNESWGETGGRLRLLRSANDLDDVIVEVPPVAGTLLAFKRSDNSWHGHQPFVGERRVIQFNWLTSQGNRQIAMLRHHASASFKRVLQTILPGRA